MKEKLKAYWEYVVLPVGAALSWVAICYVVFSLIMMQLAHAYQATAYYVYEEEGYQTKTCVYEYMGDYYYLKVRPLAICPMTIRVNV